jgi:hypothetical protein
MTAKSTAGRSRSGFPDRPENRWMRHLGVGVQTWDLTQTLQHRVAGWGSKINKQNKDLKALIINNLGRGAAGIDWTDENTIKELYGAVDEIILKSLAAQRELALDLYEAKKVTYNGVIDGRVVRRRIGNRKLDSMLTKKGMKKIDKNFDMAIITFARSNNVGRFQPPPLDLKILDNPKVSDSAVPPEVINNLIGYLNRFNNIALLREEEEE